jgi:hypothetical protein
MPFRIALLFLLALPASADYRQFLEVTRDSSIETSLKSAAEATHAAYPKLKHEDLAISVIDVSNPMSIVRGDYQGDAPFYPASVVKMFFMADVFATQKESVGDMDRALREMIVVSDNDATAYIVDILANTVPAPTMEGEALAAYVERRREINRRFQKLGYTDNVSAMMKTWSFGPFGVDLQVLGKDRIDRNRLSANATASLFFWIVRGRAPGSDEMMALLERPLTPQREDENQVAEFIGQALPTDAKLWSKAGWTNEVRNDAAYVEWPDGRKLIVVIFTRGIADDVTLVPAVARNVFSALGRK